MIVRPQGVRVHHAHRVVERVSWGIGAATRLVDELDRLGSERAALVCGSSVNDSGLADLVLGNGQGLVRDVLPLVRAGSPRDSVERLAAELARRGVDAVVVLGGGSAIVTARAAVLIAAEGAPVDQLATRRTAEGWHAPRPWAETSISRRTGARATAMSAQGPLFSEHSPRSCFRPHRPRPQAPGAPRYSTRRQTRGSRWLVPRGSRKRSSWIPSSSRRPLSRSRAVLH